MLSSYWGLGTPLNKALWAVFACCVVAGAVMLPLGWTQFAPCVKRYESCRKMPTNYKVIEPLCREERDRCGAHWARVWLAGVIVFCAAAIPLSVFCCCSKPPVEQCGDTVPTATTVAMQHYPRAVYQPIQSLPYLLPPEQPYTGIPVTVQPVMYVTMAPSSQQAPCFYSPPPPRRTRGGRSRATYSPPTPPPAGGPYMSYSPPPPPPTPRVPQSV